MMLYYFMIGFSVRENDASDPRPFHTDMSIDIETDNRDIHDI